VIVVPFDQSLSEMSAEDFCGQLVTGMTMVELVGGPDLALGHGRSGTPEVLRSIGERHGFELTIVPAFELGGVAVRTRVARQALEAGDVNRVAHLLGRPFSVTGPVVHGQGRGRTIGVPTANVAVAANLAMPANGVYAVRVWVGDHQWGGAANLGVRPTFGEQSRSLEIHLLDFTGDLYGQVCRVEFLERLRAEQRFSSVSELISQIQRDIVEARQVLSQQSPHR
jgi:riboflavin kinase/FMN adenylyltransferase